MSKIDARIDQVRSWTESPENLSRLQRSPRSLFQVEEPVGWCKIFGFDANRFYTDPQFYFEQNLRQKLWRWENFPDDDAPITLEMPARICHYPEYTLVGMDVSFTSDGIPIIRKDHPLSDEPKLNLLRPVDFKTTGWMPRLLKWYDDLDRISAGRMDVTLYAGTGIWWRGCLDLAIELRGYENFITDTVERPQFLHDLLQWLTEQRCRWWGAYYKHFGLPRKPVNIADDWINIPFITPQMFTDFVLPCYLEIEQFHGGINSIHSCGNQVPVQKDLLQIRSLRNMEISPWSDLEDSLKNIPRDKVLYVSVHANDVLFKSPQEIETQLQRIADACRDREFVLMTSGLTPTSEDIDEYIGRIRTWTQIAKRCLEPIRKHDK